TRIEMQQLLERLWTEQGFTSLLITHDVEEAVVLADRIVLIEDGQISMDVKIDLPRPRARGDAKFAKTVEKILNRVMGQPEYQKSEVEYVFSSSSAIA
ncbi:MAG: aliphatic sulfonate ABC transporter ATP-binding protein, partial [Sphaerospermopsis kisseleviana]